MWHVIGLLSAWKRKNGKNYGGNANNERKEKGLKWKGDKEKKQN